MDSQLKRGILETCVLAVLAKGDSYGYQIGADLATVIEISESTLYTILKRLKRRGYTSAHSVEGAGRLRVYYSITFAGRARIAEFVNEWEEVEKMSRFITGTEYQ